MSEEIEIEQIVRYRVFCQARWEASKIGCCVWGPWGININEARRLALEKGWKRIDHKWACPSHVDTAPHNEE